MRSYLLKKTASAKLYGSIDSLVRYNPYLSRHIADIIRQPNARALLLERALMAAQHTPYGTGRSLHLPEWPALEKELLRSNPRDFITRWPLVRIPAGTGGTTGIPLKLWRSWESIVAEQFFIDRLLAPFGYSMRSKTAVLRADSIKDLEDIDPPYGKISHNGARLTLSSLHLSASTVKWFHDALITFSPSVLWIYPSAAINLLTLLRRENLHLSIPVILASSELLPSPLHLSLKQYFSAQVINYYGQAERLCFACSYNPDEFYFDPDYGMVELSLASNDTGNNSAHIIATSYWNMAMPLVRYNTGDLLYFPPQYGITELAEIAAGKRPFLGIAGREGEYLLTHDGVRIIGLNQIPREAKKVFQMQLVQHDTESVHINVLAMPGFTDVDAREIKERARAKIPASIHITVQVVEQLKRTARGKTPLVIRAFSQ